MDRILVIGSSGHAKVVIDTIEQARRYAIAGLIDRFRTPGETTFGYSVLGAEVDVPRLMTAQAVRGVVIAIGDNFVRQQVAALLDSLSPGIAFATAVHPSASIGRGATLGAGTVVMAGAVVNADASVGRHCILNTRASLDHDSALEDFASLGPAASTGGHCRIGRCTAIGIGARLVHRVSVGEHSVVGAGATVLRSIGPFQVAYGTPALPVRNREAGEPYL